MGLGVGWVELQRFAQQLLGLGEFIGLQPLGALHEQFPRLLLHCLALEIDLLLRIAWLELKRYGLFGGPFERDEFEERRLETFLSADDPVEAILELVESGRSLPVGSLIAPLPGVQMLQENSCIRNRIAGTVDAFNVERRLGPQLRCADEQSSKDGERTSQVSVFHNLFPS